MPVLVFIKDIILATFSQIVSLFAGIFFFGLIINFVSQLTFKSLEKAFGRAGVYFVAWLGTPIHELGHVIFCILFMHKIVEVEFFKPDPAMGTLGYVQTQTLIAVGFALVSLVLLAAFIFWKKPRALAAMLTIVLAWRQEGQYPALEYHFGLSNWLKTANRQDY